MTTPASLPELPPVIFTSLQTIERALAETPLVRARHIECDQALQAVAQYCIAANKREKEEASAKVVSEPEPIKMVDREIAPKQGRVNAQ